MTAGKARPWVLLSISLLDGPPDLSSPHLMHWQTSRYQNYEVIVLTIIQKILPFGSPWKRFANNLERFHFQHIDSLAGAKAGALNACMKLTSPKAELHRSSGCRLSRAAGLP